MSKEFLFTAESIKALPLGDKGKKPPTYRDTRCEGLELDCKPPRKGYKKAERKLYFYRRTTGYDDRGKPIRPRHRIGASHELTPNEARQRCVAIARADDIAGGVKNQRGVSADFNVEDMLKWYLDTRDPTSSTPVVCPKAHKKYAPGSYRNNLISAKTYVIPAFGRYHISEIRNSELITWEDTLIAKGVGESPRVKALTLLRKAFYAARKRKLIDPNLSFPDYIFSSSNVARTSKFTASEFRRLWHFLAIDKRFINTSGRKANELQRATRLLMLTGARKMEILQAKWCELENTLNGRAPSLVVSADRQKSRRAHHIVLSQQAQDILREQRIQNPPARKDRDEYIFEYIRAEMCLNRSFADQGKFENTPHDIRRTVSTAWGSLNYADKLIERCLGHLPKGVTNKNYNQYEYLELRFALMQDWANILENTMNTITHYNEDDLWGATDSLVEAIHVGEQRQRELRTNIQDSGLHLVGVA